MSPTSSRARAIPAVCLQLLLALVFTAAAALAAAPIPDPHHIEATSFGQPFPLGPAFLFKPGDDTSWAAESLNDSNWQVVSTARSLASYGFHDLDRGWYRTHVHLRAGVHHLSIGVLNLHGSSTLYVNGIQIGSAGTPGMARFTQSGLIAYPVPDRLIGPDGQLTLAIRVGFNASGNLGRGTSTPIDSTSEIYLIDARTAAHEASYIDVHGTFDNFLLSGLSMLVAIVSLTLFAAMRTRKEYLAATIALLAVCLEQCAVIWESIQAITFTAYVFRYIFLAISNVAIIEFVRIIVRQRRTRWLVILEAFSFIAPFFALLGILGYGSYYFAFAAFFIPMIVVNGVQIVLLVRGSLRRNMEAGVLLPAVLAMGITRLWDFVRRSLFFMHVTVSLSPMPVFTLASFNIDLFAITNFLFFITILQFLVLRTISIARERARIGAELEAARTTQQFLMSRDAQATPGFTVETVYYPASEVGGDFFLISSSRNSANADGAIVVIVGDVSGKGLKAAMRVAMILGVLRREESRQPAAILHHLNTALLNDSGPGFTTACCLRIEPDGHYTLANAGHIFPYIDGQEIETPPALPLGLASEQHYEVTTGTLNDHQTIVLVSDGVVEAQSSTGELLGFDRLATLTTQPAKAIAEAARTFGQEDDITVLTVTRQPATRLA